MKKLLLLIAILTINSFALDTLKLIAPSGGEVTIIRDDFGVPHITADNEADLFFGQGFATGHDRIVQLFETRIYASGRTAEYSMLFDNGNYEDLVNQDIEYKIDKYTDDELEIQFNQLSSGMQTMINSYAEGINRYIDSAEANPSTYMNYYHQLFINSGIEIEKWDNLDILKIIIHMSRIFGAFGGYEYDNYNFAAQIGEEEFNSRFPINDPDAYATVLADEPGIINNDFNKIELNNYENAYQEIKRIREDQKHFRTINNIPNTFGSFAALVSSPKSLTGNGLFLGCPQMGTPYKDEKTMLNEVELNCPTFHAGGASVTGIPGIIIGRTENFAWTFTSGTMDNTDLVQESLDETGTKYFYNDEYHNMDIITDTIYYVDNNMQKDYYLIDFYRTIHGPVVYLDTEQQYAVSKQFTFWQKEIFTWQSLYDLIKAKNYDEVEDAISECTISFNFFYMDNQENMKFNFLGIYPKRNFGVDPRFPRLGDGTQEWTDFYSYDELPKTDNLEQAYIANWNNKPAKWWDQGDVLYWISGTNGGDNAKKIDNFLNSNENLTYQDIKDVPREINAHGTYQQAFEFLEDGSLIDENILPPGQSGFINLDGTPSEHFQDQWQIFTSWNFKDMLFGEDAFVSVDYKFEEHNDITLYPNPAVSSVEIKFYSPVSRNIQLNIYDLSGNLINNIYSGLVNKGDNLFTWNIDNNLSGGVYFYQIITDKNKYSGKIIVQ